VTKSTSRRTLFAAGAGAAAVMGTVTTPARADSHDEQFRHLSAEYDVAIAEYRSIRAELDPMESEFESKVRDGYGCIVVPMDRFWALRKAMGVDALSGRLNDASSKVDAVTKQIRALPTLSIYAIAVKLKILAFDIAMAQPDTDDLAEMDWDQDCYFRLLREVEALASSSITQNA